MKTYYITAIFINSMGGETKVNYRLKAENMHMLILQLVEDTGSNMRDSFELTIKEEA
jgi:hypothetical protein